MYLVHFVVFCYFYFGVLNTRACGASATSEKRPPWNFGACILCILSICVAFSLVCPMRLPAALWRPQKKHALGFLEHVGRVFSGILLHFLEFQLLLCDSVEFLYNLLLVSPSWVDLKWTVLASPSWKVFS
jgi:hypothetical protein